METKTIIEYLNDRSVSIVKKQYLIDDGKEYYVGDPHRTAYVNSELGRDLLRQEVPEPYYSSIMDIWGEHPLVENVEEI